MKCGGSHLETGGPFQPHTMYDPQSGQPYPAATLEDHLRMEEMRYAHEEQMRQGGAFGQMLAKQYRKANKRPAYKYAGETSEQGRGTDDVLGNRRDAMQAFISGNATDVITNEQLEGGFENMQNNFAPGGQPGAFGIKTNRPEIGQHINNYNKLEQQRLGVVNNMFAGANAVKTGYRYGRTKAEFNEESDQLAYNQADDVYSKQGRSGNKFKNFFNNFQNRGQEQVRYPNQQGGYDIDRVAQRGLETFGGGGKGGDDGEDLPEEGFWDQSTRVGAEAWAGAKGYARDARDYIGDKYDDYFPDESEVEAGVTPTGAPVVNPKQKKSKNFNSQKNYGLDPHGDPIKKPIDVAGIDADNKAGTYASGDAAATTANSSEDVDAALKGKSGVKAKDKVEKETTEGTGAEVEVDENGNPIVAKDESGADDSNEPNGPYIIKPNRGGFFNKKGNLAMAVNVGDVTSVEGKTNWRGKFKPGRVNYETTLANPRDYPQYAQNQYAAGQQQPVGGDPRGTEREDLPKWAQNDGTRGALDALDEEEYNQARWERSEAIKAESRAAYAGQPITGDYTSPSSGLTDPDAGGLDLAPSVQQPVLQYAPEQMPVTDDDYTSQQAYEAERTRADAESRSLRMGYKYGGPNPFQPNLSREYGGYVPQMQRAGSVAPGAFDGMQPENPLVSWEDGWGPQGPQMPKVNMTNKVKNTYDNFGDLAKAGSAGLIAAGNADDRVAAAENLENLTNADQNFNVRASDATGNKGGHLINSAGANFRPDEIGATQFAQYAQAKEGGATREEYLTDAEIQKLIAGGAQIEYL